MIELTTVVIDEGAILEVGSVVATRVRRHVASDLDLVELDPFGEWANPQHFPEIMRELRVLQVCGVSFSDSVAFVRQHRPTQIDGNGAARDAQLFWAEPTSKAHLLNAIFRRGARTITEVETDETNGFCVPSGKVYAYFKSAGIEFQARPRKGVKARTLEGEILDASIHEFDPENPLRALLVVARVPGFHWARWSNSERRYRLESVVPLSGVVRVGLAARASGVSARRLALMSAHVGSGSGQVPIAVIQKFIGGHHV